VADGGVLLFIDRWLKYCRNKTISKLLKYRGSVEIGSGWWSALVFRVSTKRNGSISLTDIGNG
jgi:hypothetical protein